MASVGIKTGDHVVLTFEEGDDAEGERLIDEWERKGYRIVSFVPFADPREGRIDIYVAMARPVSFTPMPN